MPTENIELLHKIVTLQSCIIQGRDINTMLHKDKNFYKEWTQSDIISIYLNENEQVSAKYVLEDHHLFKSLVTKYVFSKKSFKWKDFSKNCIQHFTLDKKYKHIDELYELFKGFISKKKVLKFSKEIHFKEAIIMPINTWDNKETIGYICFIFQKEVTIDTNKLEEIKILFETLLRPLHDKKYNIFYSKCVRVDERLKLLTEQEKRIVKKVLEGKSYPEIAKKFNLSVNTIKTHMKNIFQKYQVNSKMELYHKLSTHS